MKVLSWNLLRVVGAAVRDVGALIVRERPDLLLMQEATADFERLTTICGGYLYRAQLPARIHGLAAWSPHILLQPPPLPLALPTSPLPGRVPPRVAQIVRLGDITVANVHLSHGQILNRLQLRHIASLLQGPTAIIGDFNAVGPTLLPGFHDVGPREPTHVANNILPFRLDRCLVRGLHCARANALDRGPSDHCPIVLELVPETFRVRKSAWKTTRRHARQKRSFDRSESLFRSVLATDRIRVWRHNLRRRMRSIPYHQELSNDPGESGGL